MFDLLKESAKFMSNWERVHEVKFDSVFFQGKLNSGDYRKEQPING